MILLIKLAMVKRNAPVELEITRTTRKVSEVNKVMMNLVFN